MYLEKHNRKLCYEVEYIPYTLAVVYVVADIDIKKGSLMRLPSLTVDNSYSTTYVVNFASLVTVDISLIEKGSINWGSRTVK